jgi:hypothetical protein
MVRIGEGFELGIEAGNAAAILGRCGVLAGDIVRIGKPSIGDARSAKSELVFPAIAEIVGVGQLRRMRPKQCLEAQLGGPAVADALAADGKLPQMRVLPSHGACSCLSVIAIGTSISRQIGGALSSRSMRSVAIVSVGTLSSALMPPFWQAVAVSSTATVQPSG